MRNYSNQTDSLEHRDTQNLQHWIEFHGQSKALANNRQHHIPRDEGPDFKSNREGLFSVQNSNLTKVSGETQSPQQDTTEILR